jgi:hypothetical protein
MTCRAFLSYLQLGLWRECAAVLYNIQDCITDCLVALCCVSCCPVDGMHMCI